MGVRERLRRPGWRLLGALALAIAIGTTPRWGAALLSRFEFFHLRQVRVRGVRFLDPAEVVRQMRVDTLRSVWDDPAPLVRRLRRHPQIAGARIRRRPPGTLVVTIEENLPVALVPRPGGMQPFDGAGRALPIDPSRQLLDLPVLATADPRILSTLDSLRLRAPAVWERVSEAGRDARGDLVFRLDSFVVRAPSGVSAQRLTDIFPVEHDLARRGAHAAELDLRYRDQVIARLK